MRKFVWIVFWALVVDFLWLLVNFIPVVAAWSMTLGVFIPLLAFILFFVLGIALLALTLSSKITGLLRTFLILTGAIPIAIPISFVLLDSAPETIANIIFYSVILAFLAGIIGSIVLSRKGPKEITNP